MNKWQDLFDLERVRETIERDKDDTFEKTTWYIIDKISKERVFNKSRPHGYSEEQSAKCGAAHMFRQIIKAMEKELLGKK